MRDKSLCPSARPAMLARIKGYVAEPGGALASLASGLPLPFSYTIPPFLTTAKAKQCAKR